MKHISVARLARDPFGERAEARWRARARVLGADVTFESNSRDLLKLVDVAYRRLPRHSLSVQQVRLRISLRVGREISLAGLKEPPDMKLRAGADFLCGTMDSANFVVVAPAAQSALVAVSSDMLRWPYHARYELIEFAVFTLASRAQRLVPLHAASVALGGKGVLLVGQSGAGKSTLAFHCLRSGMGFVSEDSTFIEPSGLRMTGVPNFLHLRADSLDFLARSEAAQLRKSRVIRRRSGIEKFEIDMRQTKFRMAPEAPRLAGIVFLSARGPGSRGAGGQLLVPLDKSVLAKRLAATQSYAAGQDSWSKFVKRTASLPAFELRRGVHPQNGVEALQRFLDV